MARRRAWGARVEHYPPDRWVVAVHDEVGVLVGLPKQVEGTAEDARRAAAEMIAERKAVRAARLAKSFSVDENGERL